MTIYFLPSQVYEVPRGEKLPGVFSVAGMELIHPTNTWAPIMCQSPWEVVHKKGLDRASQLQDVEGHRSRDITVPSAFHYDQRSPSCSRGTLGASRPAEDFQKDVQVEI